MSVSRINHPSSARYPFNVGGGGRRAPTYEPIVSTFAEITRVGEQRFRSDTADGTGEKLGHNSWKRSWTGSSRWRRGGEGIWESEGEDSAADHIPNLHSIIRGGNQIDSTVPLATLFPVEIWKRGALIEQIRWFSYFFFFSYRREKRDWIIIFLRIKEVEYNFNNRKRNWDTKEQFSSSFSIIYARPCSRVYERSVCSLMSTITAGFREEEE